MTSKKKEAAKKSILIAENSRLVARLLAKTLEESGCSTITMYDGLKALEYALENRVDCIICNTLLPGIDGSQICTILKEGTETNGIPFILYTSDEQISDFWAEASNANRVLSISPESVATIASVVEELIPQNDIDIDFFTEHGAEEAAAKTEENPVAIAAVRAMDKNKFFTDIYKAVISLYDKIEDFDALLRSVFKLIFEISGYEAAGIILSGSPCLFYYAGIERLSDSDGGDFRRICRTDFEKETGIPVGTEYDKYILQGIVKNPPEKAAFASYRSFVLESDGIAGTLHITSTRNQAFTYKIASSIQFMSRSLGRLLKEALNYRRIFLSEKKMRTAFSKFVPEEIIDDLLKSDQLGKGAGNEKRKVAILICDIRNFTSISEINQPENVVGFLNGYFTQMVDIIKKHGGSIDKFMGDAIMALFGAPISYVDNARRAVSAALEMVSMLSNVQTSLITFPPGITLDIGIGIHYGDAIVGNIGSKEKSDYTVIGDSVNLASRLEGLTKQYGAHIIISGAVREELGRDFNLLAVDTVKVKGKTQGVKVFRADNHPLTAGYAKNYEKGLDLYTQGAWKLAQEYFEKAQKVRPEDKAARLMIERCKEFAQNPPENWNGAVALTSK